MKNKIPLFLVVIATAGCQSQTTSLYQWGNCQHNLLDYVIDLQGNDVGQTQAPIMDHISKILCRVTLSIESGVNNLNEVNATLTNQ